MDILYHGLSSFFIKTWFYYRVNSRSQCPVIWHFFQTFWFSWYNYLPNNICVVRRRDAFTEKHLRKNLLMIPYHFTGCSSSSIFFLFFKSECFSGLKPFILFHISKCALFKFKIRILFFIVETCFFTRYWKKRLFILQDIEIGGQWHCLNLQRENSMQDEMGVLFVFP